MASAIYLRDDLSVYVVAGVPRSFQKEVAKLVKKATKESGDVKLVNGEMAEWVVAKLKEDSRRSHERTPASAALWRAFRALSAARYHIQDEALEKQVRRIRDEIEELWASLSPLHKDDASPEEAMD
jgi:hypothetical protein